MSINCAEHKTMLKEVTEYLTKDLELALLSGNVKASPILEGWVNQLNTLTQEDNCPNCKCKENQ